MANPYLIGTNTPATGTSQAVPVATGTGTGDTVIVAAGSSAAASTVSSVTDTKGNTYTRLETAASGGSMGDWWISANATPLTTSDTITVTFGAGTGTKTCVAGGVPGVASSPVDQIPAWVASNSTNAPSVTTGTLAQASEIAIGVLNNESVAGAPVIGSGFTQFAQVQAGASPFTTLAYKSVASTSAITFSASWASLAGAAISVVTLKIPAAAAPALRQQPYMPPRRLLSRAYAHFSSPTSGIIVNRAVQPLTAAPSARRRPVRAQYRFVPVVTVNAPPVAGTVQPRTALPAARRRPARALARFVPVTTTNPPPVPGTVQPRAAVPSQRRRPVRAQYRFTAVTTVNAAAPALGGLTVAAMDEDRSGWWKKRRFLGIMPEYEGDR